MGIDSKKEAAKLEAQLIAWRRALHQIPETGICLPETVSYITEALEQMGVSYKVYRDISCVAATIGSGDRCILLRSDMDALPVSEEANLFFKSTNGNMHGCGHDMHAAVLLGAAAVLKAHETELKGCVKLLFQSGEEVFQGAKGAIKAGILSDPKVDAAFAMHVIAAMPVGVFATGKTPMSAVDVFQITVTGHGGHGSMPESCVDPINAGVQIYLALQSLIAREKGGTEEAVLTIGQFTAGEAANVIPERALLQGTLRTFNPAVRERMVNRLKQITSAVALAYRCESRVEITDSCAGVVCDAKLLKLSEQSIKSVVPEAYFMKDMKGMGSEDFAEITVEVPSAYYAFGAGVPDKEKWTGQHNPNILFNEDALVIGTACYAQTAWDYLNKNL